MFSVLPQRWIPCLNLCIPVRNIGCTNVYTIKDQLYTIYQETEFVLNSKQDSIPVGGVHPLLVATLNVWGWRLVGPEVNKFEQVSSDDHQISLTDGGEGGKFLV